MALTRTCAVLQIVRSLADAPTPTSPPTSAAAACLWEVLAYALCKANLSQQEGVRLFAEAGAAIQWAVKYKASPSAPAAAAFQTFASTFGSFWKWVCGGACPAPADYRASLLQVCSPSVPRDDNASCLCRFSCVSPCSFSILGLCLMESST